MGKMVSIMVSIITGESRWHVKVLLSKSAMR